MYPNPVKESFNLELTTENSGIIKIFDSYGQPVKVLNVRPAVNTIDVGDLTPGIYFMTIVTSDGFTSLKFIKE